MSLPQRKQIRLKNYDYSSNGACHIIICTHRKQKLFWKSCRVDPCGQPQIELTELGKIAEKTFSEICEKYKISVDKYVIMPNHVHLLVSMYGNDIRLTARVNPTIPRLVGAYKSIVSNTYLKICKERNVEMGRIWQVSYFDHVIRGPQDYEETWRYIDENPLKYILKKGDIKNAENS